MLRLLQEEIGTTQRIQSLDKSNISHHILGEGYPEEMDFTKFGAFLSGIVDAIPD